MNGVSGRDVRERERDTSIDVFGRSYVGLPRLLKLPALVALKPPADWPLIRLWLVRPVLLVIFVLLLCTPLEELVVFDLLVALRLSMSLWTSCPDRRPLKCRR